MAKYLNINGSIYDQTFTQILDNVEYIFHVYYNKRSGWYLSVYDPSTYDSAMTDNSAALIVGGRKLMPIQNVLSKWYDERLPTGNLYCIDTEFKPIKEQEELTDGNFGVGNRYMLIYYSAEEIAELS